MLTRSYRMARPQQRPGRQTGVTLIELMVGLAVGLIVISGALFLLASLTQDNRRLLVETRLNQDLRAASDLIARDLRRAGYWAGASAAVYVPGATSAITPNPYRNFIPGACSDATLAAAVATPTAARTSICYYIEQGTPNNLADDTELFGFALVNGVVNAFVAGKAALPLTDPQSLVIDSFQITPRSATFDMAASCTTTPPVGTGPQVVVRRFDIVLRGFAPSDPGLIRGMTTTVRVRNDAISGTCP